MTTTLEGFAKSAGYAIELKNDSAALQNIFGKIPREFHDLVLFMSAEYQGEFAMSFRLTIDGKPFVAINSRNHPSIHSFELFHDGYRYVLPIFSPENFGVSFAQEHNTSTVNNYKSVWLVGGVLCGIGLLLGLFFGSWDFGLAFCLIVLMACWIFAALAFGKYDNGDFRQGINTSLRDSTIEALNKLHQS